MDFLGDLLGALGSLAGEIASVIVYLFNLLIAVFQFLFGVLQIIGQFILDGLKAVGSFFAHLWTNFFKGIFTSLLHGIQKLSAFLESKLRPVIQFLMKVRKYIDKIYKTYVAPFLKVIQHIRQFLQILKLLHLKFAADLDRILGQVQRDVQGVFFQIRAVLNTTIDLLNILADPSKLLRKPTLVLSMRRTIHALIRQVTGLPPGWYFPSPSRNAPKGLGFLPPNFNPANPDHNPPASYYLGLDDGIPSLDLLDPDAPVPNELIDGVQRMDYFNSELYPEPDCVDITACMRQALDSGLQVQ